MRRVTWFLLLLGVLQGCGPAEEEACPVDQGIAQLEDRLRFQGFRDPSEVERLTIHLRRAALGNQKQALVDAIHYPLTMYEHGTPVRRYVTPEDVLAAFDSIFSEAVLTALRGARYRDLFVRDQGAMIGRGEVWLYQYEEGVRIKAINP